MLAAVLGCAFVTENLDLFTYPVRVEGVLAQSVRCPTPYVYLASSRHTRRRFPPVRGGSLRSSRTLHRFAVGICGYRQSVRRYHPQESPANYCITRGSDDAVDSLRDPPAMREKDSGTILRVPLQPGTKANRGARPTHFPLATLARTTPHHRGNASSLRVAAPKSTNPTSTHQSPAPNIGSRNVAPKRPPTKKVSTRLTSKIAVPVKVAKKPAVPSLP
jgi:hypothetical protein